MCVCVKDKECIYYYLVKRDYNTVNENVSRSVSYKVLLTTRRTHYIKKKIENFTVKSKRTKKLYEKNLTKKNLTKN